MKPRSLAVHASTFALVVALACTLVAPAQAQDASTGDQNSAAELGALQPIVITAEKRSEDLQAAAVEVQALSGTQIQQEQLTDVSSLTTAAAGFQSSSQGGFFVLNNIRGIGSSATVPTMQQGVAIIRDGLINVSDIGRDESMFDVADTEVLQGPQGTFIGASAIAGAVEINSVNPNFNGTNGFIMAGIGNYTSKQLQGAVNLQFSDTFAMRLAFNLPTQNSFFKDIGDTTQGYYYTSYSATNPASDGTPLKLLQGPLGVPDSLIDPGHVDTHQYRLKALWKPSDNFQMQGLFAYTSNSTGGQPAEPSPVTYQTLFNAGRGPTYPGCSSQSAGIQNPGSTGEQLICPEAGITSYTNYYYPGENPFTLDYYGQFQEYNDYVTSYSLTSAYTLTDGIVMRATAGMVKVITKTMSNGSSGPQDASQNWQENGPTDNFPQAEIDIISPTNGTVNWITGASWYYRQMPVQSNSYTNSPPYAPFSLPTTFTASDNSEGSTTEGVFAQVNWQMVKTLQLSIGVRENWDSSFSTTPYPLGPAIGTVVPEPEGLDQYRINYTGSTPTSYTVIGTENVFGHYKDIVPAGKINLSWTPLPAQNFYVFYARGYKAGGINEHSADLPTFNPETVNDWEAGWKGTFLDNHLRTQVGAWWEVWQNFQYEGFDPVAENDTSTETDSVLNLTTSKIYGIELSEQARFGGFGVNTDINYLHTALGALTTLNFGNLPAGFGSPYPLPQCLPGHNYAAPSECFNYLPYEVNLSGEELTYAPRLTANISVDYIFHIGNSSVDPRVAYSHTDKQYASIFEIPLNEMQSRNLWNASLNWVFGKYAVELYGNNLTNEVYYQSAGTSVYYGAPRQFGVQLTYRF